MKKIVSLIMACLMPFLVATPVLATSESESFGVETAILKECSDEKDGVVCLLNLVIDIMTIGIGILGVIGITIVGIQYLTAGGNEEKTRKAKTRMFDIVIGLVAYAAVYGLLKWLLPAFNS
ncbi:hypothetical protein IKF92_01950 [Candidatus Saccharibacteria bacterium]|nr:hypothetical protein [Candidatus Saccharibacteria bacterium]